MTTRRPLLLLLALYVASTGACSVPTSREDSESSRSKSERALPPPDMEVRDYEPEAPTLVENSDDLFRGLPRADFREDVTTKDDSIPKTFTLAAWDTPVKNQGSRPWCTSFAQISVMENMIRHGFGDIVDLSEIDHFQAYRQYSCYASIDMSAKRLIVPEASYPYYGNPIANHRNTAIAKITSWKSLTKRSQVFDALRAGRPVHFGVDLLSSWNSPGKNGKIAISGGRIGGHAMAIVGYVEDPEYQGGGYLLIKNSWGSKWGDLGYARMPYDYCNIGNCIFLDTLGVTYQGKTWDGSTPPPAPPPADEPTANDLAVTVRKDPHAPNKFTLFLSEKKAGALAQVSRVTYDVHETFHDYRTWSVTDPADGFVVPFFYTTTFKGRWSTNGAAAQLKSGKILQLSGAVVTWYAVD